MLKKLFIILFVLIVLIAGVGVFLPSAVHVERSTVIAAPPEEVHAYIANFKDGWSKWSPLNTRADETLTYVYEGPDSGVGAVQAWTSEKSGNGRLEIVKSDPQSGVEYEITYSGTEKHRVVMTLDRLESGTKVTWTTDYDVGWNIPYRYMSLMLKDVMNDYYDAGLAQLKNTVEQDDAPTDGGESASDTKPATSGESGEPKPAVDAGSKTK